MLVEDIWKLPSGSIVRIEDRLYEYNNVDGARVVRDIVIDDEHYVDEWFTGKEEIWVGQD